MLSLNVIRYCAEEVKRQGESDPMRVYDMCNAWDYASHLQTTSALQRKKITVEFIEHLGVLTDTVDNHFGFRQIAVFVGTNEKAPWHRVPSLLTALINSYYEGMLDPIAIRSGLRKSEVWPLYNKYKKAKTAEDVFYFEYENIHPFRDGNGRTGKILYNYLRGTLDSPVMPPNFWGTSNP